MISTVCEVCGAADEEATQYGGMHLDCIRRTGKWYQRAYQATVDGWWTAMHFLFD